MSDEVNKSYLVLKTARDRPYSIEIFSNKEEAEREARAWLFKTLVDKGVIEGVAREVAYRGDYSIQDGLINAYKYQIMEVDPKGTKTTVFVNEYIL